jgi:hypothetical protein
VCRSVGHEGPSSDTVLTPPRGKSAGQGRAHSAVPACGASAACEGRIVWEAPPLVQMVRPRVMLGFP